MFRMWNTIFKILYLYSYFTIISAFTNSSVKSSYQIFIESIFQSDSSFMIKNDSLEDCRINLNGNSLLLECLDYFYRGQSMDLNSDETCMLFCLDGVQYYDYNSDVLSLCKRSQNFSQGCVFSNCNRNVQKIILFRPGILNGRYFNMLKNSIGWIEKCQDINSFFKRVEYFNNFTLNWNSSKDYNQCLDYNISSLKVITELRIVINLIDIYYVEYYYLPNEHLLRGMENLDLLELNFQSQHESVFIVKQLFKGLTKLSTLKLINCNISFLTEDHFQDFVNLKTLTIQGGIHNHHNWLSFQVIRNQLMFLELDKGVLNYKPNITAFTCTNSSYCGFNVDIQKKPCPVECTCYLNRSILQFIIDCDRIEIRREIPELPIPIIGNTSLYFNNRSLTQLPHFNLYGYSNIKELHVANNKLKSLTVDQLPENLTYLDLRNNSLQNLDYKVLEYLSKRAGTISINLSGNPWSCNCDLFKLLDNDSFIIGDRDQIRIKCQNQYYGLWILLLNVGFCKPYFHVISGFLLGFAVITLTLFCFKNLIMMWLYERNICLSCVSRPETRDESVLKIDAFLAFFHIDLQLVEEFVEKLEKGSRKYQLCFYQRDWLIGESIPACILNSIEDSKRIIILMTNNFINSSWGLFEFRTAIKATSMNKEKRLIVILYPGVDIDELDSELKVYMKYNTYLRRDDPLFWRKLIFAMPHKQINCKHFAPTDA